MTRLTGLCCAALPALLLCAPPPVGAQDGSAAAAATSAQAGQGSIVVEPIRDTFVVTPDVRITDLDHSTRTLFGGYAGMLVEDTLMLGAGGYWLVDGSHDQEMAYGGFVAQWTVPLGRRVRVGVRGLVGGGHGSVGQTFSYRVPTYGPYDGHGLMGPDGYHTAPPNYTTVTAHGAVHTDFFVAEPQADVVVKLAPWLALNAGGGYRAVGWANGLEEHFRGAVGSIGLRFGRS